MIVIPVEKSLSANAYLDSVHVSSCGTVFVLGWNRQFDDRIFEKLTLHIAGQRCMPAARFRLYRPDVAGKNSSISPFAGICIEYHLTAAMPRSFRVALQVSGDSRLLVNESLELEVYTPDYVSLRQSDDVAHRINIYGYGPPSPAVNGEVLELALSLKGSVLDFGCGMGALIAELRDRGYCADGLELDRTDIRNCLLPSVRPHVTLYDGTLPSSYADKSYDNVICSEVLEHILDYRAALREMTRIARRALLITVPDIEVIPLLHKHGVVPWHLLEAAHVNFFNHYSLRKLLAGYFQRIQLFRIGPGNINGTLYWNGLAAICSDPIPDPHGTA